MHLANILSFEHYINFRESVIASEEKALLAL
jgi:hypothetical protein